MTASDWDALADLVLYGIAAVSALGFAYEAGCVRGIRRCNQQLDDVFKSTEAELHRLRARLGDK